MEIFKNALFPLGDDLGAIKIQKTGNLEILFSVQNSHLKLLWILLHCLVQNITSTQKKWLTVPNFLCISQPFKSKKKTSIFRTFSLPFPLFRLARKYGLTLVQKTRFEEFVFQELDNGKDLLMRMKALEVNQSKQLLCQTSALYLSVLHTGVSSFH